jgi:Protein of unknown function (DUF2971)
MVTKLYRYEKLTEIRCKTAIEKSLWLSSPANFNDLYDCRIQFSENQIEPDEHLRIMRAIDVLYPEGVTDQNPLTKDLLTDIKNYLKSYGRTRTSSNLDEIIDNGVNSCAAQIKIRNSIVDTTGVTCFFSAEPDNPLMWAHYADNHEGFCIEYEITKEIEDLHEVNYSSQHPTVSATELIFSPRETFKRVLTTKISNWSYEKEYRLIKLHELTPESPGKKIPLPEGMRISRIIAGAKMMENFKLSNDLLQEMNKNFGLR